MVTVNIHEAKSSLSKLIDSVSKNRKGIIIAKAGIPIARLEPLENVMKIKFGVLSGKIKIDEDFKKQSVNLFQFSMEKNK